MVFTAKGDDGTTGWLGKGRLSKSDPRIEALGVIDEATAALGVARSLMVPGNEAEFILSAQRRLYQMMAEVAATPTDAATFRKIDRTSVTELEDQIHAVEKQVEMPRDFIVPGDSRVGAALSLSRTVVRRAERRVVELSENGLVENPMLIAYLNRLSTLCFLLELYVLKTSGLDAPTLAKEPSN